MGRTDTLDVESFKQNLEQEWRQAAPGWRTWYDTMETEPGSRGLSRTLIDRAGIGAGDAVLDVGAGYGEPGLGAAEAVAPDGRVVLQDLSAEMLAFAADRLEHADLADVDVAILQRDAEDLDLPDFSFDAVISRAAIMYFVDVAGTLARLRTGLKPGGRLAASVWAAPDEVGFASPLPIILDELRLPPPPQDRPGPFALGDRERLAEVVADAGFVDLRTGSQTAVWEFDSREACTRFLRDVAPPVTALVAGQPDELAQRVWQRVTDEAWEPFTGPDGRVRLPNLAHWISAETPR